MTAPSKQVRAWTYSRDNFRCVSCGSTTNLEWQHRASSGMGGRGRKAPPLTTADGVTLCTFCNSACEGALQRQALQLGYKIRRNTTVPAFMIPWFDTTDQEWFVAGRENKRHPTTSASAHTLLVMAGSINPPTPEQSAVD